MPQSGAGLPVGLMKNPGFEFDANSDHILWAAEVWYSIKKHWVLELQRLLRAQSAQEGRP